MVTKDPGVRKNFRRNSIIQFVALLVVLVLINIIASVLFTRFDLSAEKRFSISESTKENLKKLNDVIYIKVYLDGDLPPAYKRLRNGIKESLDEFKVYAGDNLEYEFIDPSASSDQKERNQVYQQLAEKGLQPTNLKERGKGETTQKIIFPGAILSYAGKEISLQLLKSQIGMGADEMTNNSIEGLEYEFMNGFRKISTTSRKKIAFLQGHGELNTLQLTDAARSLSDVYQVDTLIIGGRLKALQNFDVLIVAKPESSFIEQDKFIIDQFVMNGGKIIWLLDQMTIDMDSLSVENTNVAIAKELNLDDLLFHYGVRINFNLLMDLQAAPIPIVTGYVGNQPQQNLFPWYFYPLITSSSTHPIVHNLNAVKLEFTSSIDSVESPGIRKTVLLSTSQYSKKLNAPVRVSLNILQQEPEPKQFNNPGMPVAMLLEGKFTSNFKNRVPETIASSKEINFKTTGKETKMIVIADGDAIASHVSKKGSVYPLGYDRFTGMEYGNKNFLLNCVDYLLDDSGLMSLRSKEFKIRLLDKEKSQKASLKWINLLTPVITVVLFGIIYYLMRKKRFS